jgi:hypothetical protein
VSENEAPQAPEPTIAQAARPHWLLRFGHRIYIHNPFYLLSVAFVLHSTRLWLNTHTWPYDPWPLMDIIGGYILQVAVVGCVVIRLARAWDDARSIFFILLLLFVELSLTFDPVLVSQPRLGLLMLVIGWSLAVAVSEGLFWILRIRLPLLFRVPYHLVLALLFLYPPLIVAGLKTETVSAIWRIWAFSPVSGLVLLTFLPAIRRGPDYVRANGTPWTWPLFPWSLFVFLVFCLGARSYALTLSFDSVLSQGFHDAMQLQSAFAPFFLVPLVLACGVLLLEAGLVARNHRVQRLALSAPVLACFLSGTFWNPSIPAADFLRRFTVTLGSPLWLALGAGLFFFGYTWLRGLKEASRGVVAALLFLGVVNWRTLSVASLEWQSWPFWIVGAIWSLRGIRLRRSRELFFGGLAALGAARLDWLEHGHWLFRVAVPLQLGVLWAVALGAFFDDAWGRRLRSIGLAGMMVGCLLAALSPAELPAGWPWWSRGVYLALVVAVTIGCAYAIRSRAYFFAGLGMLTVSLGRVLHVSATELERIGDWKGAGFFILGLVWLGLAVLISSAKAGAGRFLARLVPRK